MEILPLQSRRGAPMFYSMPSILLGSIGVYAMTNNSVNANLHQTETLRGASMCRKKKQKQIK